MKISQLYRGLAHYEKNQSLSDKPEGGVLLEIVEGPEGTEEILVDSDHRRCHEMSHDSNNMEFDSYIHIMENKLEPLTEGSKFVYLTTGKLRHEDCIYILSRGVHAVIEEVEDK